MRQTTMWHCRPPVALAARVRRWSRQRRLQIRSSFSESLTNTRLSTLASAIEAALLAAEKPLNIRQLAKLVDAADTREVESLLSYLRERYAPRGYGLQILKVANGYFLATKPLHTDLGLPIAPTDDPLPQQTWDVLTIIAYRQPIGKAELEAIMGFTIAEPLRQLTQRRLITATEQENQLGRPKIYRTSDQFLDFLGLNDLADLPPLTVT